MKSEILEAIGAHGTWKMRLKMAAQVNGKGLQPEVICRDDQCRFGQWLHGLPAGLLNRPEVREVRDLHARFHRVAGDVARDIVAGEVGKGMDSLQSGEFDRVSSALMMALQDWRRVA